MSALAERAGISEAAVSFSSRVLADVHPVSEVVPTEVISSSFQDGVEVAIFTSDMVVDSAIGIKELDSSSVISSTHTGLEGQNEHNDIPEIFRRSLPPTESLKFIPLPRISEQIQTLGTIVDKEGVIIGEVNGLVVGRTRLDKVTDEGKKVVEVATYARNDHVTPFSKIAKEGITVTEIMGDTGDEVKIVQLLPKEEADELSYSGYWQEVKAHFSKNDTLNYNAQTPLQERIEWLGPKRDERGEVIGKIEGSVIGRDGQDVVVIDKYGHTQNKTREILYVRWDPQHPNQDLLHIEDAESNLVQGDTGIEVEIIRYIPQEGSYPVKDYSGWYKRKDEKLEVVDQRVNVIEQKIPKQEKSIDPNILAHAPLSIRTVPIYPSAETKALVDELTLNAITKNSPTLPIFVAENYRSSRGIAGYLETNPGSHGGRDVWAEETAYKGEVYFDDETKTRMVRISRHFHKQPGNMLLADLARQENFGERINKNGQVEYVVNNVITLEEAIKRGHVFSEFIDTTSNIAPSTLAA